MTCPVFSSLTGLKLGMEQDTWVMISEQGEKLYKMLDLTIKGLMTERFLDASFQPEMLYEEIVDYVNMMKKIVYQSQYPHQS